MWCPEISFPRILCVRPVLYPEETLWHCFISDFFHVILDSLLKENFSIWVTRGSYVGHIRIALWVSGSTGVPTFNPAVWVVHICVKGNQHYWWYYKGICDWSLENWPIVTQGLFHFIVLAIATLMHYSFTVPLPGLADWSAFLGWFLGWVCQPCKFMTETIGAKEGTTWKAWSEIDPSGSEMSLRSSKHVWGYG